jgi:hypothetical protein
MNHAERRLIPIGFEQARRGCRQGEPRRVPAPTAGCCGASSSTTAGGCRAALRAGGANWWSTRDEHLAYSVVLTSPQVGSITWCVVPTTPHQGATRWPASSEPLALPCSRPRGSPCYRDQRTGVERPNPHRTDGRQRHRHRASGGKEAYSRLQPPVRTPSARTLHITHSHRRNHCAQSQSNELQLTAQHTGCNSEQPIKLGAATR